jgi:hypothetical protein
VSIKTLANVLFLASLLAPASARGANAEPDRMVLYGHVPPAAARLTPKGRLPATHNLCLAIGLPLRNQAALDELLRQIYDPQSTNFHQFLTPPEFTARFGPTEQDYQAVISFAEANGLAVTGTHDNRVVLDVEGSVSNVERAFRVTLRTCRHPGEARDFFAPDTEPSVPANLPVADMWGLTDYGPPKPLSHKVDPLKVARLNYNGSGPGRAYEGGDFRNAYVPGAGLTGSGQIAAVAEFDGYYANDITTYESQSGYTHVPLQNVLLDGVSGTPGYSGASNAVAEVSLDIELLIAMAPGLSTLIVYQGKSPYDVFNRIVTDNLAKQVSCSWSWSVGPAHNWGRPGTKTLDSQLQQMAAQGQTFFQASGDSDAYTGSQALSSASGPIPVDSIFVTSVGGTTLNMSGAGASWSSETVWNWGDNTGSGGGVSPNYAIPAWQTHVDMAASKGSTVNRNIPDVALTADGVYVVYDNGSSGAFGGTSCAAPLWAGFCALVNQQSIVARGTTIGFLNPALYAIGAGSNYTNCFHDIATGNNIGTNTPGFYNAVANYDLCTGLGTPNGTNLINALAPLASSCFITWTNPAPITYGTALGSVQLNATASVSGSFAYTPTNGTVLNAGTNTLSVVFTPADTVDYSSVIGSVSLVVLPASLAVTAANASRAYGQPNPPFTGAVTGVTNGDNLTAAYSCSATAASPAGTYPIVPSLVDPSNLQTNYQVTLVDGTLTVLPAAPSVTWTNPAPITYGTALGSVQLNATASVSGNFAYTPTNGTVLNAGTNTLSVIFTPADTVDYTSVIGSVSLVVLPAPLTVTAANASRAYGQLNPALTGAITGVTNGDNITAAYSCSATAASPAGTYPIIPSLVDPSNLQTNYQATLVAGTLTVLPATPSVTWTNPAPITYGTALSSVQLNATASVSGSFAYTTTNGTVLNAGTNTLSVIFTPADTVDYSSVIGSVSLAVLPAPLTVTAADASRVYGQPNPAFTGAITGVTNGDNITAAYGCSATAASPAGTYPIIPSLVDPSNLQTNYQVTLVAGTLTVLPATPSVAWTNPAPITYGTALSSVQLNATASVSGSFAYTSTNGTVLNAGTNTVSVIFTPADTADYGSVIGSVSLAVLPAPLTVTAANAGRGYGQPNPAFTGAITGVTNGDNITAAYGCSATAASPAGTYPIIPSLVDPSNLQTNYQVTLVDGTLTVLPATPSVTWTNPAPITYGTALSSVQLNATASVSGSFAYTATNGTVLNAGTNTLSVIFTAADTLDYGSVIGSVSLAVLPAPLTVTAADASRGYGQPNPAFTGVITGVTNGDNITAAYSCSATAASPAGTYPIIPSLVDPSNLQTNYQVTLVAGTLTVLPATPSVTWTNPAPITYGTALSSVQLNATASVSGSFAYTPTNGTVLNAGTNTVSVIFTAADTLNYSSVIGSVSLAVLPAPLTVTAADASRGYGQPNPAFTGVITGVTNGDNITAAYGCSATAASPAGTYPIIPSLVDPSNLQTNYQATLVDGTLTVLPATPSVTWTNPAPITYGTALSSVQLNATASVSGSFAYTATNGTMLNAGTNTLSVIFTPADTLDYGSVIGSVSLAVLPASLTVTAADASRAYGQPNPAFTGAITGVTNGDNITAAYSCSATAASPAGTYPIIPSLLDPRNLQTNYQVTLVCGALTVTLAAPPTVVSVTPDTGLTNGGTTVTILGTGFENGATVAFGALPAGSVDVINSTNLTAVTPPSGLGTVDVAVTNADGQSAILTNGFAYATTLAIVAPPVFQAVTQTNGTITLTWSATAGQTYQVQYNTNLSQPHWTNLVIVTATNSTAAASDALNSSGQRFYRTICLP